MIDQNKAEWSNDESIVLGNHPMSSDNTAAMFHICDYADYYYVDYYRTARDSFLTSIFPEFPNITIKSFRLSFLIGKTTLYAPLIYQLLELLPKPQYTIVKNKINISINTEQDLIDHIILLSDLLTIVKSWRTTELRINEKTIGHTTEFKYLVHFLAEKNNLGEIQFQKTALDVQIKYTPYKERSRNKNKKSNKPLNKLSQTDLTGSLTVVINRYIDVYCRNTEISFHEISGDDKVIVIENSLVLNFRIKYWRDPKNQEDSSYIAAQIYIQELTHNDLFKFNLAAFKRLFEFDGINISYFIYRGVHYYNQEIDNFDFVNKKVPELKLCQRCDNYPGENYHFIILRIEDVEGTLVYGVGTTKSKVHSFVLKLCQELEAKNSRSLELNGASCLPFRVNQDFIRAFLSWKGKKKRWRLENKFSYFCEDRQIKNELELFHLPFEIVSAAKEGLYNNCIFGSYNTPINRWKSEELVYNITKKLYDEYQVIYQYRPFYLATENGNMSYDVYICGLKIAIEYQGKQHFEPVDYFGGEDHFQKQLERDKLKAKRSRENGVKLIYVNYWQDITPKSIKEKVEEALREKQ